MGEGRKGLACPAKLPRPANRAACETRPTSPPPAPVHRLHTRPMSFWVSTCHLHKIYALLLDTRLARNVVIARQEVPQESLLTQAQQSATGLLTLVT